MQTDISGSTRPINARSQLSASSGCRLTGKIVRTSGVPGMGAGIHIVGAF